MRLFIKNRLGLFESKITSRPMSIDYNGQLFQSLILPPSPSLTNRLRPLDGTLFKTSRGRNNLIEKQLCINFSRVA